MEKLKLTLQDIYIIAETLERTFSFINWKGVDEESRKRVWAKIINSQIVVAESEDKFNG